MSELPGQKPDAQIKDYQWEFQLVDSEGKVKQDGPNYYLLDNEQVDNAVRIAQEMGLPVRVIEAGKHHYSGNTRINPAPEGKTYVAIIPGDDKTRVKFQKALRGEK